MSDIRRQSSAVCWPIASLVPENTGLASKEASQGRRHKPRRRQPAQTSGNHTMNSERTLLGKRHRFSAQVKDKFGDFRIYEGDEEGGGIEAAGLRKELRRRTIYVPSDDTTIFTIHAGSMRAVLKPVAHSIVAGLSADTEEHRQTDGKKPRMQRAQRESLAATRKKAPLQPSIQTVQESWYSQDRNGSGPGKENLAPQIATIHRSSKVLETVKTELEPSRVRAEARRNVVSAVVSPTLQSSLKSTKHNRPSVRCLRDAKPVKVLRESTEMSCDGVFVCPIQSRLNDVQVIPSSEERARLLTGGSASKLTSRLEVPLMPQGNLKAHNTYPPLHEDICRPDMYDDTWMSDQESALAQLFNALFEAPDAERPFPLVAHEENRRILLRLYQEPSTVLLFKRLQASIVHGALRMPKESFNETSRQKNDIGFRQKFINFWTKTFDLHILRAAAEVVIGREVPAFLIHTGPRESNYSRTTRVLKKSLESFIDVCLLRNEDTLPREKASVNDSDPISIAWCWQRTMLRSLMMVFLLDRSKELKLVHGNLFLRTSEFKSIQAVLKEVSRLLIPSVGDVSRLLARLEFHGSHVQYPLDEYDYRVENLATQFRDGIRLTRLVEFLLYPTKTSIRPSKDTTTTLPTREILSTCVSEQQSRVLSQHLKIPCPGRSQKLYNVQLALSALQGVPGVGQIVSNVTAEDFVNGHREKTIMTLWGLVGKWGLGTLVDCAELSKEIRRLESLRDCTGTRDCASDKEKGEEEGFEKPTNLLKVWAQNIARLHSLTVSNLTTSFADGKVFTAIVDEYERYLPYIHSTTSRKGKEQSRLNARLRQLGCSTCFGKFFLPSHTS